MLDTEDLDRSFDRVDDERQVPAAIADTNDGAVKAVGGHQLVVLELVIGQLKRAPCAHHGVRSVQFLGKRSALRVERGSLASIARVVSRVNVSAELVVLTL